MPLCLHISSCCFPGLLQNILYICTYLQSWGQSDYFHPLAFSGILQHACTGGQFQWLVPTAPILIQLFMETAEEIPQLVYMLPGLILGGCSAVNFSDLGPENEVYNWLKKHPKEQQQIKAALTSTPFRNALWAALASHVRCLHEHQAGTSSACGCKVPSSSYCAATGFGVDFDPHQWMKESEVDLGGPQFRKQLLIGLTKSYMSPPAGDVLLVPSLEQSTSSMPCSSSSNMSSSTIGDGQSSNSDRSFGNSPSSNICSQVESRDTNQESVESSKDIHATSSSSSSSSSATFFAGSSTHGLATVDWVLCPAITVPDAKASLACIAPSSVSFVQSTSAAPPARPAGTSTITTASSSSSSSITVATQLQLVLDMLLLAWPPAKSSSPVSSTNRSSSSSKPRDLNTTTSNGNIDDSTRSNKSSSSRAGSGGASILQGCCSSKSGPDGDYNSSTSSDKSSSRRVGSVHRQFDLSYHSWLLLFIGLLQEADAEAKKQFMDQRVGLLLQLLYHAATCAGLPLPTGCGDEGLLILDAQETARLLDPAQRALQMTLSRPSMLSLIWMLLQALLYEGIPLGLRRSESFGVCGTLVNRSGAWCSG